MQHAGGHDEVELTTQGADLLDGEQVQLEVLHRVLIDQVFVVIQRRLTHVDRDDLRGGIVVGKHRGLIRATPGNEDVHAHGVFPVGPEDPMRVARVKPLPVIGQPARQIQDRGRVDPLLVLAGDDVFARVTGHVLTLESEGNLGACA